MSACIVCGGPKTQPLAVRIKRKVCSIVCLRAYQAKKRTDRIAQLKCRQCGKPPAHSRMAPGGFCSYLCFQDSRRGKGKTRRAKTCETCGAAFTAKLNYTGRWARFCSSKCLTAHVSKRPAMLIVQCEECFAVFRRTAGAVKRSKRLFCSRRCASAHLTGEMAPAWRGGSNPNRGAGWIRLAEAIRERDGRVCLRCNKSEADNGEKLSVDHIVPWRMFKDKAEANDPQNLVSLCRECHSWKTHSAERKMLTGDRIQFEQYKRAITLPPLFARVS